MSDTATTPAATTGPGATDAANAAANPVPEQVTQPSPVKPAEGAKLAKAAAKAKAEPSARPDYTTIADATVIGGLAYDDSGRLVDDDGRPVALSADATDLDVGWTVQHRNREGKSAVQYPSTNDRPDQTFHPSELPHPQAAIRAGLLPQNAQVLNIDPDKFAGKKSLEA